MKRSICILTVILLATSSVAVAKTQRVEGKVVGLDTDTKSITVETKKKGTITYRYVDGIKVKNVPLRKSKVSDLTIGTKVTLLLEPATK